MCVYMREAVRGNEADGMRNLGESVFTGRADERAERLCINKAQTREGDFYNSRQTNKAIL